MKNMVLCCCCGEIFESADGPELQCPHCGWRISAKTYKDLLAAAQGAVKYGWQYRRCYEAQMAKYGRVEYYYRLAACEEALHFAALAAVSGIIGGMAYDGIKKIIQEIAVLMGRKKAARSENSIFYLIDHPEEMDKFIQYIDEYYTCFDSISEEVRNAIFEEMIVDKMSPTMDRLLQKASPHLDVEDIRSISPFSEEEIFRCMLEVRRDIDRRHRRDGENLDGSGEGAGQ